MVTRPRTPSASIFSPRPCWTISPRDGAGQLGPLEQALMGTPIADAKHPVEALRVIHSVDPCLDCATHVVQKK